MDTKTPVVLDGKYFEILFVKNEIVKAMCTICKEQKNEKNTFLVR